MREPRSVGPMVRDGVIALWQSRGGGFYGLGYALTFAVLELMEIPELFVELADLFIGDSTMPGALFSWAVAFVVDTLMNMAMAFAWPALVINALGGVGIALVVGGFVGFERFIRPLLERLIPELALETELPDATPSDANQTKAQETDAPAVSSEGVVAEGVEAQGVVAEGVVPEVVVPEGVVPDAVAAAGAPGHDRLPNSESARPN